MAGCHGAAPHSIVYNLSVVGAQTAFLVAFKAHTVTMYALGNTIAAHAILALGS